MRDHYWDNWKGIAIIAVVLIHVLGQTGSFPLDSFNNSLGVFLRQFVNFAVAVFFFLSGYFTPKNPPENFIQFYKKRISRILIPYLVWSVIYILIRSIGEKFSIHTIIFSLLFGTGIFVGYFVIVLIQLVILTPLFYKINSKAAWLTFILFTIILSIGYTYYFQVINPNTSLSKFPFYAIPFFIWLPFYLIGFYVSKTHSIINLKRPTIIILCVLLVLLSLIEAFYWHSINREFSISQLKITTYLTSIAVCFYIISAYKPIKESTFLTWLGVNSYFIYLSHMLVLTILSFIINRIPFIYNYSFVYLPIMSFGIIVICSLMKLIILKIFSPKKVNELLG